METKFSLERLKELRNQIVGEHWGINGDDFRLLYDLLPLVDEATALQSATTEEVTDHEPCEWCKGDFRYMQGGVEKRRFAEDDDTDYVDIECWGYCPVCGRKLKENE